MTNTTLARANGSAVTLANYNEVANLHIDSPGTHGIIGVSVTGADIHDNLISGFNSLRVVDEMPILGRPGGKEGIRLLATGQVAIEAILRNNVIEDGVSGALLVLALDDAAVAVLVEGNSIADLDGSTFLFGGKSPAIGVVGFDRASVRITIRRTSVDNVANFSDGLTTVALDESSLDLDIQEYSYSDTAGVSGSGNGIETITQPEARTTLLLEKSDISGSGGVGFLVANFFGNPGGDVIDLGGGALGSVGQNRIFDSGRSGHRENIGLLNADTVALQNWWGRSDGLRFDCPNPAPEGFSCARLVGNSSLDFVPFLTEDPRP